MSPQLAMLLPSYEPAVPRKSISFAELMRRPTTWLWLAWFVVLSVCSVAELYIMAAYPTVPSHPPPWSGPVEVIQSWTETQSWISLIAAVAPLAWERRWYVLLAAALIAAGMWGATHILAFINVLDKTGAYF